MWGANDALAMIMTVMKGAEKGCKGMDVSVRSCPSHSTKILTDDPHKIAIRLTVICGKSKSMSISIFQRGTIDPIDEPDG